MPATERAARHGAIRSRANLFAFPAQSNFSGVKHPLALIDDAHTSAAGTCCSTRRRSCRPTGSISGSVSPDFVAISFYKMFGYPTGVGCLLIRNAALATLRRPWFAGGTVNFATVQGRGHVLAPREAGFEDGTLNYLSIPAVEIGLRHLERVGIDTIQTRVRCLTGWLLTELLALRHGNGRPHGAHLRAVDADGARRHGDDELLRSRRHLLDYRRVEELAGAGRHLAPHRLLLQSRARARPPRI